jgi:hypothetical protein
VRGDRYAGIAPLRPLFMFFKPQCYMFEIWFMLEKLLLVGVFGIVRARAHSFVAAAFSAW